MNKNIEWLTVLTFEKQTGIPNATIRRYIRNHGHHLNIRKKGKSYFIASESTSIILSIRKLYDDGKTFEQVEESLIKAGTPMTVTVIEKDEHMIINVGEALQNIKATMNEQNKIIQSLVEQIKKQQEYIDTKLEKRDQNLIESIRKIQEVKKEIASTNQQKKWYQFWRK